MGANAERYDLEQHVLGSRKTVHVHAPKRLVRSEWGERRPDDK